MDGGLWTVDENDVTMTWAHPERWTWGWLAPALIAFWVWAFRHRARGLARFAAPELLPVLTGAVHHRRRIAKAVLVTLGLGSLWLALVGPQWGFRWEALRRRGVDLVIGLDVSKSMLAEDVKPNRLERAKLAIRELLPELRGDRIGLIAFAGTSFAQCPLTVDYGAFALTLEEVTADTIPRGGTALGEAIRSGLTLLQSSAESSRALVLITDGEDHTGEAMRAAEEAAKRGVRIFCVGIGTAEGELIPVTDAQGQHGFLKDREGRTVKSRLDEALLQRIALATGGSYVHATPTAFGLDLLYHECIVVLKPQETGSFRHKRYEQRFQWVLAAAFMLLVIEACLSDRARTAH